MCESGEKWKGICGVESVNGIPPPRIPRTGSCKIAQVEFEIAESLERAQRSESVALVVCGGERALQPLAGFVMVAESELDQGEIDKARRDRVPVLLEQWDRFLERAPSLREQAVLVVNPRESP